MGDGIVADVGEGTAVREATCNGEGGAIAGAGGGATGAASRSPLEDESEGVA